MKLPAVVLLGSIASDSRMWLPQIGALQQAYRVIAIDHRGHGKSPAPKTANPAITMADLAADVLETLDNLEVSDFHVAGLSLGGAIAQYLSAYSQRVQKAAFLCTAPAFGGAAKWNERAKLTSEEGMKPLAALILSMWETTDFAAANPQSNALFAEMISNTNGIGYASCAYALGAWNFDSQLGNINIPVLTIAGAKDPSTPPTVVHAIGEKTAGPHTALTVPGAHVPTYESASAVTNALVNWFDTP